QVSAGGDQYVLLIRAGRSGLRGGLRGRFPRRVSRSGAGAAGDRVVEVHRARHADVYLPPLDSRGDSGFARLSRVNGQRLTVDLSPRSNDPATCRRDRSTQIATQAIPADTINPPPSVNIVMGNPRCSAINPAIRLPNGRKA